MQKLRKPAGGAACAVLDGIGVLRGGVALNGTSCAAKFAPAAQPANDRAANTKPAKAE